jgi:hypothetical protein
MAKVFSMFGLFVALALLVLFALDLGLGMPFMGFSTTMDVGFVVAAVLLGYLSFSTYRELP